MNETTYIYHRPHNLDECRVMYDAIIRIRKSIKNLEYKYKTCDDTFFKESIQAEWRELRHMETQYLDCINAYLASIGKPPVK